MLDHRGEFRSLPLLSVLTTVVAILTMTVVMVFRAMIAWGHEIFIGYDLKSFDEMADWQRFLVPIAGSCLVALVAYLLRVDGRRTGVTHVVDRSRQDNPKMPTKNTLLQFFGGGIALSSGSPGGWLGPSAHLGAACASLFYSRFSLPDHTTKVLLAAGVASAITACLDTPIAAVLLAWEVILLRITFVYFLPVILAAGITSVLMWLLGFSPIFEFPDVEFTQHSAWEFAIILPAGIAIGLLSAGFNYLLELCTKVPIRSFPIRCLIVGVVVGVASLAWPLLMGPGFQVFYFELEYWQSATIFALIGFAVLKLLLVGLSVGFGMPVGIMGPCLAIGAVLGVVIYKIMLVALPDVEVMPLTFYMLIATCAMFAAVTNAPLAALVMVLELSAEPQLMFPAMLLIVVAALTEAPIYGRQSVYESRLEIIDTTPVPEAAEK